MFTRNETKKVQIGDVTIGGGAPILVQSMTNTKTWDVEESVRQIEELSEAGCELVRLTVPNAAAAEGFREIRKRVSIPLVADIHFDYKMALLAMEAGADKIRINPGNLGGPEQLRAVVSMAKERHIPIRVGVNAGSLEKGLKAEMGVSPEALCQSALHAVQSIEDLDYDNLVVSLKASDLTLCARSYELFAEKRDYPLHLGITEAGTLYDGCLKSAMGLGIMLDKGLGDTIRVSLTADPVEEVCAAQKILQYMNLRKFGVEIVSCPTCGRTEIDLISLANRAQEALSFVKKPLKVAVMGCIVNGPGEAGGADFGIAGGKGEAVLFRKGEIVCKIPEDQIIDRLVEEAKAYVG